MKWRICFTLGMNDTQLCQCGCGRAAIRRGGRRYAQGHRPKGAEGKFCACGCGRAVKPGSKWRRGHWTRANRDRLRQGQIMNRRSALVEHVKAFGGVGGMVEHSASWDDQWAVIGNLHLRDTAEVLDILGRYGCVEVSYAAPHDDPLLDLDLEVDAIVETHRVERIKKAFREAGFAGLRPEEVKYAYLNGYETVEDYAA